MALTDVEVKKAKPAKAQYKMADGHGLYLAVTPQGSKIWRWKYYFEGKERSMSFGRYPEVSITLARKRHADGRIMLAEGVDPVAIRKAEKAEGITAGITFQKVAEEWHQHWSVGKSPRHADYVLRRLKGDIFPVIGYVPITEVEAPALVSLVKAIEGRGANDIAKRALETIGQVFRYAIAHGKATRNPAADFKPRDVLKSVPTKNYARIEAKELPSLLRHIEAYPGTPVTRMAVKLMAHTFVRTSELIGARWGEFNLGEKRWDIPAERMKMRTPHIVPLSFQVVEILETLRLLTGNGALLLPGERNPAKPMSNNTILQALERMGYKGDMTGHGFRGLASTILHEQGFEHAHIELQLAHAPRNAVSAAYNHAQYLAPRAQMMQWWSNYLEEQQRGKVLPMRQGVA